MAVVLADLGEIIATLQDIDGLLRLIYSTIKHTAQENVPYEIATNVAIIESDVVDGTFGLAALQSQLATFQATTAVDVTSILTAIADLNAGTGGTGTVSIDPSDITTLAAQVAIDVWEYFPVNSGSGEAQTLLLEVVNWINGVAEWSAVDFGGNPLFYAIAGNSFFPFLAPADVPTPLVANILAGDDLLSWLLREDSAHVWSYGYPTTEAASAPALSGSGAVWICKILGPQFAALKAMVIPVASVVVPPVWPGIANVTLGATVALADGLVISGPLDGLIVVITSVPTPISYYPFGAIRSYVRAGAVIFTSDNDDSEFPQPLGPDDQVILPRSMATSASATFRVPSGVVGTVQSFTIP